jgi:phenol 2-monooxygenase (NADPH)
VCDGNVVHLGHHARADGRWRIYAFADAPAAGEPSALAAWADWMSSSNSPLARFTPAGADVDAVFDVKVIYQQPHEGVDIMRVPEVFRPETGPFGLMDWEKVFAAAPSAWCPTDIFEERGVSRDGAVVVVRPDQYVAHVLPLTATNELAEFFAGVMVAR